MIPDHSKVILANNLSKQRKDKLDLGRKSTEKREFFCDCFTNQVFISRQVFMFWLDKKENLWCTRPESAVCSMPALHHVQRGKNKIYVDLYVKI